MLFHLGRYLLLLRNLFRTPEKFGEYWDRSFREMNAMGVGSLVIVVITSAFIGAVTTIQTAYQLTSALIPEDTIGMVVSESTLLELAPTVICLVLAGKIGSSIASEIGTMRVTEQIEALEVMGVNAPAYLIMPKIISAAFIFPFLIVVAAVTAIAAGVAAGQFTGEVTATDFISGAREVFRPYDVSFMLIKSLCFGFIITTISAYQGYYTKGGALEVGTASTRAVVYSCVTILFADYILAQLLL